MIVFKGNASAPMGRISSSSQIKVAGNKSTTIDHIRTGYYRILAWFINIK